jgi:hypothetical protein
MGFEFAAASPIVRFVVVVYVAEQKAGFGPVDNHPEVAIDPRGPEVSIFAFLNPMEFEARLGGIELEVDGSDLGGLLFLTGEPGEAVRECVGDPEFHGKMLVMCRT